MKKNLLFIWLVCIAVSASYAQGDSLTFQKKANKLITYSVAVNVATLGQTLFYSEENFQLRNFSPAFFLTNSLQHLPNLSLGKGFGPLGLQAAATAGFYVTKNTQTEPPNFYNRMLFVPAYNVSLFASYTAYRDLRLRHLGASDSWQPYKVHELLLAPYHKETIKNPFVWGTALGAIGINLLFSNSGHSVFRSGKTFIGTKEYRPLAALPLMIGANLLVHSLVGASEEAHYRGVFFEQMQRNASTEWAHAFDILYFTASHFPQYYIVDRENVLGNTLRTAAFSFLMSSAYRHSGLRTSSAAHMLFNFCSSTTYYLLNGGAANDNNYIGFNILKTF